MKTTLEIDQELLTKAKEALGTKTTRETVHRSLAEAVRRKQLQALADALGTIPLDLTPSALRRQRRRRAPHAAR